jgi:hypothetical protein
MTEQSFRTRLITYTCMHTATFRKPWPKVGDELICNRCRTGVTVFAVAEEWRNKCDQCRFGRTLGSDAKTRTIDSAMGHATRFGHTVKVYYGESLQETITPAPDTLL